MFASDSGGLAQLARALAWHARGHEFESRILHPAALPQGGAVFHVNPLPMKTDAYSRVLLTVITVCVVVLTLRQIDLLPRAAAGPSSEAGFLPGTNADGSVNVRVVSVEVPYGGFPVEVKSFPSRTMPVEIKDVPYGGIPVEVKRTVPVKVENSYIYTKPY